METVQEVRFYNGGDPKDERMQYTAIEYDVKAENGVRYFVLAAPRKGFFYVPREIRTDEGAAQLLGLPTEVMEKYGERGFVMIDRNLSDEKVSGKPFLANSDELAKEKGDKLWREYCLKKIREFEDNDQERIARGMAKARPSGFIVHMYREVGIVPPAAEDEKKAIEGQNTIEALRQQVATLTALVTSQQPQPQTSAPATGKKARP